MADPGLIRRLRAARALAGYTNVADLAAAIDQPGLGVKTLRSYEQRGGNPSRRDLWEIANACRVPLEFFTDPDYIVAPNDRYTIIDRRLAHVEEALGVAIPGFSRAMREIRLRSQQPPEAEEHRGQP